MNSIANTVSDVLSDIAKPMAKQVGFKPCDDKAESANKSWREKHLKLDISHPKVREMALEVQRFCGGAWQKPNHGRMLVLAGKNGVGKTMAAKAVQTWINANGHGKVYIKRPGEIGHLECLYWPWAELLDTFKNGGWDAVEEMFFTPVLIIDDLGAGHDPSGVGTDKLCQVLSRREKKWTLITTNIMPSAWQEKFDRRVASRLIRNSTLVDLSDVPDFHS